jgi:Arc/MetJ-type ribon-helix-helix transcriptional regulator
MDNNLTTISLRIPKVLNKDIERYVKLGRYASKTELLREAIRAQLYGSTDKMRGALKNRAQAPKDISKWREQIWQSALKKAGGDKKKAVLILEQEQKKSLEGLKL